MGLAISAARTSIKEVDESQRKAIEERLHVLEQLVESKLDKFELGACGFTNGPNYLIVTVSTELFDSFP